MNENWSFPNAATPPGSGPYYVARFAPTARRDEIAAWFAWFALIDHAILHSSDPGATRLKLDWWHDEVERAAKSSPQHPLSLALTPAIHHPWQIQQMHRLLNAAADRLRRLSPKTPAELASQCREEQAARLHLLSGLCMEAAEAAAFYIGVVARLQRLPQDLQRRHLSLPLPYSTAESTLEAERLGEPGVVLIKDAERGLPAKASALPYPSRALLAQHRRIGRVLVAHGCPTRRVVAPTPLGLLWSAWRSR